MKVFLVIALFVGVSVAQFVPVQVIVSAWTGEEIPIDAENRDIQGCLVGPGGERVCTQGAFGASNDRSTFRGNAGPAGTGSNGNAAPIDPNTGIAQDPAVISYLKQLERYAEFEKREFEANKRRLGTA